MFRAIILPIFRNTRLCYGLWYNAPTMLPATGRQHRGYIIPQVVTHSLVLLKMGKNNYPKHGELTGIINKPLFLHLFGCLYYLYKWCTVKQISDNEIYLLIKYIKSVLWRIAKRLSYIEDARCLKLKRHLAAEKSKKKKINIMGTAISPSLQYKVITTHHWWLFRSLRWQFTWG